MDRFAACFEDLDDPSRLPSFLYRTESIGERRDFREHGGELLDQRKQPLIGHGWNEVIEHASLPEQRMRAAFGGVRFQKPIVAKGFPGGTEQGQQRDGQRVQQP